MLLRILLFKKVIIAVQWTGQPNPQSKKLNPHNFFCNINGLAALKIKVCMYNFVTKCHDHLRLFAYGKS